ncbi:MAG: substrate-binding periplasmic protein [Candidatus Nanopelagicales bacterium]
MSLTVVPGVLRLATSDLDARPLFWNEGADRFGYEPEAAAAVAAAMGLRLEWVYTDWGGRMDSVLAGESDGVWCGVSITDERREILDFSAPYAYFNESCVVRGGVEACSPADLRGRRIGAAEASTNLEIVRSWDGVEAVAFTDQTDDIFTDLIEATASGEIDGFVDDEPAMIPLAERDDRLAFAFSVESRRPWGCGVARGSGDLVAALDDALARCTASGELAAIWRRHLPFLAFPLA